MVRAILLEQNDEWVVAKRRYCSAESMNRLLTPALPTDEHDVLIAIS